MKKLIIFTIGILILALTPNAQATLFTFSGSDEGGIGNATVDFSGLQSDNWIVTINNTSPKTLISSSDPNAPAINGLGFDFSGASVINDWDLQAYDSTNNLTTIGEKGSAGDWSLDNPGSIGSITLDFFIRTSGGGPQGEIKGSLYNPLWITSGPPTGAAPQYYTTAILNITFDGSAYLEMDSPFIRMRNVGDGGEGSLKLFGTEEPTNPIPEPATMLLLGSGLIGLAFFGRKKFFKK